LSLYRSEFAGYIEKFISYREASNSWNESYDLNIRQFDNFCANSFPNKELSQEMVYLWCKKRESENNRSCYSRTQVIRCFINYLQKRGLTDVIPAIPPIPGKYNKIPHAFSDDELSRFFNECDNIIPKKGSLVSLLRKITLPVFFRLLYSSGVRTTESRYLQCEEVDLKHGVLNIRKSKGYDQHYVALHDNMTVVLRKFNETVCKIQPNRTYFFESLATGSYYDRHWVSQNFRDLWVKANGKNLKVVPYDLRHNYAITNINNWKVDSFTFIDKLHYLSKSMGHRKIESTLHYYSIVPRLADTIQEKTETGFNEIVPEVIFDEE
jgi:site-specific recombinase XerD